MQNRSLSAALGLFLFFKRKKGKVYFHILWPLQDNEWDFCMQGMTSLFFWWFHCQNLNRSVTSDGFIQGVVQECQLNITDLFSFLFYSIIKRIVHYEINFWYVLAYLKGIQDVGVFVSTVFSNCSCLSVI